MDLLDSSRTTESADETRAPAYSYCNTLQDSKTRQSFTIEMLDVKARRVPRRRCNLCQNVRHLQRMILTPVRR